MRQIPLKVKARNTRGTAQSQIIRREGFIPAEVYGHKESNHSISIPAKEFTLILHNLKGENAFFALSIEGQAGDPILTLVKEVQFHKTQNNILHADFQKVKMDEKIRVKIPVHVLNGDTCEGVKEGGTLEVVTRQVDVQCLPGKVPEYIEVDAAALKITDSIHISQLKVPEGVKVLNEARVVVIMVSAPMAEEVKAEVVPAEGAAAAAAPGAAAAEPEVLTAKKKEGEEAAPAEKGEKKKPAEKSDKK